MSHIQHEQAAHEQRPSVRCTIITISDTRTADDDTGGAIIRDALVGAGHEVADRLLVKDEPAQIAKMVSRLAANGAQAIITTGGTGITKRDSTFEAIDGLLEKRLPGFGEIFRMLSYQAIGPAAMLSRATAGTIGDTMVFCMPGSPHAVQLGMQQLILPELSHLVWEILRQK